MLITPLPQGFGAEVSGFDLDNGCAPDDIAHLRQAYAEHHLLILRGAAAVLPERQAEIAGWFGRVGANGVQGRPWTVLDNDEAAGRVELAFHCDISFLEYPLAGISLQPLELPTAATLTSFVSNALAWDRVPAALQDDLRPRKARHRFVSTSEIHLGLTSFEHWHPVCLAHPQTGRDMLFVTEHHVDRIEGIDEARSREVLTKLFAVLYAPEGRYDHVWRVGDLVIWNNLAVQHARPQAAEPAGGRRVLRRVALGEVSYHEQIDKLRHCAGQAASGADC